jgi:hypothetical protein
MCCSVGCSALNPVASWVVPNWVPIVQYGTPSAYSSSSLFIVRIAYY